MTDAVIVSTARTPIGRAYRGAFNVTSAPTLAAHVMTHALTRAGLDAAEVEDVILGAAQQQGTQGFNVARQAVIRPGSRCRWLARRWTGNAGRALQAIAQAARAVAAGDLSVAIAGGVESISLVQNKHYNLFRWQDDDILQGRPALYTQMIDTAENVAPLWHFPRRAGCLCPAKPAAHGCGAGRWPVRRGNRAAARKMEVTDKATGATSLRAVTLDRDEGNRPDTTAGSLAALKPVREGGTVTAGNASQLSDGASACVVMTEAEAARRGLAPLGRLHAGWPSQAANPTRWASARSLPCRSCWHVTG
jgi:acetyl-CoA C-acetyltransferase